MKSVIITLLLIFNAVLVLGQADTVLFQDSKSRYYNSTDFLKVEELSSWFFVLMDKNLSYEDPIKPIGQLIFQKEQKAGGVPPNFTFQIFRIQDSAYCFRKSQSVRRLSSCNPPDTPGDIIIFKEYIFLNTNICLKCKDRKTGKDNCRPVINWLFSKVDSTKVTTIESLVKQFPVRGDVVKIPF